MIISTDKDEWIVCENAHEPIVTQELWDAAHQRLEGRRRERKPELVDNIYRSILVCADCGGTMWISAPPKKSIFFVCANSRNRKSSVERCSSHNIPLDSLIINLNILGGYYYSISIAGYEFSVVQQGFVLLALIPIWLYSGHQRYHSKPFKYFCYAFYPLHLLIVYLIWQCVS